MFCYFDSRTFYVNIKVSESALALYTGVKHYNSINDSHKEFPQKYLANSKNLG